MSDDNVDDKGEELMADDRSASMLESKAIDAPHGHYDVAVLGGGLAGLTIAIQLKRERPETRVLVTDKRSEQACQAGARSGNHRPASRATSASSSSHRR